MKKLNLFIVGLLLVLPIFVKADTTKKDIYIFYGSDCPHCEEFFTWYDALSSETKSKLNLVKYETWNSNTSSKKNSVALETVAEYFNEEAKVPFIIIGDEHYLGFGDSNKDSVLETINTYASTTDTSSESIIEKLSLDVVADKTEEEKKDTTIITMIVVLVVVVGAVFLIYRVCKSEG